MDSLKYLALVISLLILPVFASAEITAVAQPRDYSEIADDLIGSREGGFGVPNGTDVSGLEVLSIEGETVALDDLWAEKPLMLIFYRGGWCPFCNAQIRELSLGYSEFEERGVEIAVVSVDRPDVAILTKKTYEVPFPVLSDQDLVAHKAFNVILQMTQEDAARTLERRGRDYTEWSGRDHLAIAIASSFLIGTDGEVKWSTVVEDYRSRPTPEQLLSAIEAM